MARSPMWHRQPGEGRGEYAAFCLYRDMGAGRSVRKAVRAYLEHVPKKYSDSGQRRRYRTHPKPHTYLRSVCTQWLRWSRRFAWVARVEAYDAWYHAERQKEADRLAADAAIREAEESDRQARLRLGAFRLGRQTGASVIAELAERIRRGELSKLGLAFLLANAGKVATLVDVFAKNERAEEGQRSAGGTNEQTRPDLSALTTEQLIAIVNGALGPEPTSGASPSQGV